MTTENQGQQVQAQPAAQTADAGQATQTTDSNVSSDINSFDDLMSSIKSQSGEQGTPQQQQASTTETQTASTIQAEPKPSDMSQTQLEVMRAMLQQSQAQLQLLQAQQQPQQQQEQRPQLPQVDPRILSMLNSEDENERQQGLQIAMAQTAAFTQQQVMGQVQQMLQLQRQQEAQTQAQLAQAAKIQNEFYGANKDLDNDMLRPVVGQAYQMVCQENNLPLGTWNKQIMDLVTARVRSVMQPQVKQEFASPAVPAAQFGSTARNPVATGKQALDDILAGDFNPQRA